MPAPPPESDPAMIRIRAVEVIDRFFDPLSGAKFSMCTASSSDRQMPRKGSRRRLGCRANVVDQPLDELRVLAFGHDPNQRLGSGLADHEAAPALKFGFGCGDALADAIGFERRCAAVETNVLEQLW